MALITKRPGAVVQPVQAKTVVQPVAEPFKRGVGRPTDYSEGVAAEFCERVASGRFMKHVSSDADMPSRATVLRWRGKFPEFEAQCTRAREALADVLFEEIADIADDASDDETINAAGATVMNSEFVARSKLRVETRKWIASKLDPRRFGDKQTVAHEGTLSLEAMVLASIPAAALPPPVTVEAIEGDYTDRTGDPPASAASR